MLSELGQGVNAAVTGIDVLMVELLAGDLQAPSGKSCRTTSF